ncbi:hypothetical protein [Duganella flavida]|uniref:hypothetical protein n=1 Tax=Duganella flavida TaxID=2692175 RepID=UPI001E4D268E|nr:hypothetical protein [Duganella flavida]
METTSTSNRIHPLMAAAAVSLTVVSLMGAAAIAGLMPNSHGAAVATPTEKMISNGSASVAKLTISAPVVHEVVRYKTAVRHDHPSHSRTADDGDR